MGGRAVLLQLLLTVQDRGTCHEQSSRLLKEFFCIILTESRQNLNCDLMFAWTLVLQYSIIIPGLLLIKFCSGDALGLVLLK